MYIVTINSTIYRFTHVRETRKFVSRLANRKYDESITKIHRIGLMKEITRKFLRGFDRATLVWLYICHNDSPFDKISIRYEE